MAYLSKESVVHRVDARVKIVALLAFSIALFCVQSWWALAIAAAILLAVMVLSRVSLKSYLQVLAPAAFILLFIWVCNSIPFDLDRSLTALAYVIRISLIIIGSFVITFTTTSTQLTDALASLLRPLRAIRVPVDDVALTLSLALRFIPLLFEQLHSIKLAQECRAARFDTGSLWHRLKTWTVVLIPLFIGFFRQAGRVADAMDARCYGATKCTRLSDRVKSR